jgi:hypothetical protein
MQNSISPKKANLLHLTGCVVSLFSRKETVLQEVRASLQDCQNMHDLLDLLFSTDAPRDEAFLSLFEKRIQELDDSHSSNAILHF